MHEAFAPTLAAAQAEAVRTLYATGMLHNHSRMYDARRAKQVADRFAALRS